MAVDIAQLLAFAVKNNASDLHLSVGRAADHPRRRRRQANQHATH